MPDTNSARWDEKAREIVATPEPFRVRRVTEVVHDIALALAAAHEAGRVEERANLGPVIPEDYAVALVMEEREASAALCEAVRCREWSPRECARQIRARGDA